MRKQNILLTGASGTVGYEVLKQLVSTNAYSITVFDIKNRKSKKKFRPYKDQITIIYGDLLNKEEVQNASQNKDVVIHLAAVIPPLADDHPELAERVNVQGTQILLELLELNSPDAFFMYSSSISVYGDRIGKPYIKTTDRLHPSDGDHYGDTKIKAEKLIQKSKLDWTIFRLAAIMGDHKMSKLMFHQPLNTPMEIATPSDTARAFVNAIDHREQLSKRIFNLGGGEECRISYDDFLKRSFEIFGLGKLDFPIYSFAEKNFHCGYYADGDDLEEILQFRSDTLEDYFYKEENKISPLRKFITSLFSNFIKKKLTQKSDPLSAYENQDPVLMKHYFT